MIEHMNFFANDSISSALKIVFIWAKFLY